MITYSFSAHHLQPLSCVLVTCGLGLLGLEIKFYKRAPTGDLRKVFDCQIANCSQQKCWPFFNNLTLYFFTDFARLALSVATNNIHGKKKAQSLCPGNLHSKRNKCLQNFTFIQFLWIVSCGNVRRLLVTVCKILATSVQFSGALATSKVQFWTLFIMLGNPKTIQSLLTDKWSALLYVENCFNYIWFSQGVSVTLRTKGSWTPMSLHWLCI